MRSDESSLGRTSRAIWSHPSATVVLAYLILYLWCAVLFTSHGADPDLWGHVQYGRDLLSYGLDRTTTYSFTTTDYPWVNHENLSEVLLALAADGIGPPAMIVAKCLMGLFVISLVVWRGQTVGARTASIVTVCMLLAASLLSGWTMRPQLITYTFFAGMLWLLSWCFESWDGYWSIGGGRVEPKAGEPPVWQPRWVWLWSLPILFVVWTNSHGGFVAGMGVLTAYLGLYSLSLLRRHGVAATKSVAFLLLVLVATALSTLLNPYGTELHRWLFKSLGIPRPEIVEWHGLSAAMPKAWVLALVASLLFSSMIWGKRKIDVPQLVIIGVLAWQAARHHRHTPFLAIAFSCWWLPHVDSLLFGPSTRDDSPRVANRWTLLGNMTLVIVAAALLFRLTPQLSQISVSKEHYPVNAFEFMQQKGLTKGRLVTTYGWAQYAIGAFGTRGSEADGMRLGFDGRFRTCYPQDVLDIYLDLELGTYQDRHRSKTSGAINGARALEFCRPDLVLVWRSQANAVHILAAAAQRGEWIPLYQDKIAQLWGRASVYGNPQLPNYVDPVDRRLSDRGSSESVPWPAFPQREPTEQS